jgi:hypothetical protein
MNINARSDSLSSVLVALTLLFGGCGSYDGVESENGRLGIIQQANQFLNAAQCDQAINILMPLYWSRYVNQEVRMTLASGYACKAGFSFPTVVASLRDTGNSDIFSILVKAMYSNGLDGHWANYRQAATHVFETTTAGNLSASGRGDDPNVYMIFMQSGALSSVLSVLGQAVRTTGRKTQAVDVGGSTAEQRCTAQVALAVVNDCIRAIGENSTFGSLSSAVSSICNNTGGCTNLDYGACMADAVTLQPLGAAILTAIDLIWQF